MNICFVSSKTEIRMENEVFEILVQTNAIVIDATYTPQFIGISKVFGCS